MVKSKEIVVEIDRLKEIRDFLLAIDKTDYNEISDGIEKVVFTLSYLIVDGKKVWVQYYIKTVDNGTYL